MAERITWSSEKRYLKDLLPWDRNPRILSKEQEANLKESLSRFGVVEPPAINTDNTIIGGHMRSRVMGLMEEFGDDAEIDVRVPSRKLTDAEVEELNVRLNKNTGSFDFSALQTDFELDNLLDWGFKTFELGLPAEELDYDEIWGDMPEFKEKADIKHDGDSIIVHFRTMEDRAEFAELIGQKVTPKTPYIWYPIKYARVFTEHAFVDGDEAD